MSRHLAKRDGVQRLRLGGLALAQQHARNHAGDRSLRTCMGPHRRPFLQRRTHGRRYRAFHGRSRSIEADERLGVGALHEGHAEQHAQRVVDSPCIPGVGTEPGSKAIPVEVRIDRIALRDPGQRDDRVGHQSCCLGLAAEAGVHMIVQQFPGRRALGAHRTEGLGDVAQRCAGTRG
ncbi:MAG: hypothetical protein ACK56I_06365, partial [bacterium]